MTADIQIQNGTFGKPGETADSLLIELSGKLIAICEMNADKNELLFVTNVALDTNSQKSIPEQLITTVKHFHFLKKSYKNILVNYFNSQFTLCPLNFYAKENLRSLLEFNVGSVSNQLIETDDITHDIKLIYAIDEELKSTLDTIFPSHHIRHSVSVLAKLMMSSEELTKENILLSVHQDYIEIIVKQENKLILANQYSVKTQEDILYYVLFILEQYGLNPLFVSVCVAGNIESNSSLISSLRKYIRNIHLTKGHKSLNWQTVSGMPQHFNYSLINRLFCE